VPYMLVVGDREVEQHTLAVRDRKGRDLGTFRVEDFAAKLSGEVVTRVY